MKILVINGPNLNFLGIREPEIYGKETYQDLCNLINDRAQVLGLDLEIFQSNYEGEIVSKIQEAYFNNVDGIVINPAAYTHTSVAIHDALEIFQGIKIEVHLSEVDNREGYRRINYVREVCNACFSGKHEGSYLDAIKYLKDLS